MLTRLLEDSIMPAESSMRRGRACSSVMVIQLIFFLGFLFVFVQKNLLAHLCLGYQHNCFPYNLLPQMLQLTRCPSGENRQKNNERPPLWTDFHKVIIAKYCNALYLKLNKILNFCTNFAQLSQKFHSFAQHSHKFFLAGKQALGRMLGEFHWGKGFLQRLRRRRGILVKSEKQAILKQKVIFGSFNMN